MSEKKRVVITGMGAVTPIGLTVSEYWKNLCEGKSGGQVLTHLDTEGLSCKIGAPIYDFDPEAHFGKKDARKTERFTQFAVVASREALANSGLEITEENATRVGVIAGCGIGGLHTIEEQVATMLNKGAKRVSPMLIPRIITNMAPGLISIDLGLKGPNSCIVTACATGTHCTGDALRVIQRGEADAMVAGGTEAALSLLGLAGFSNMKALTSRNDDPQTASRPFDKERDGFLMGEGAGMLVLEELEHAKARGAHIYAEIVGYGMSGDAYHITAPDPEGDGGARAMRGAMNDAGLAPEDVDYVNAHGTSTPLNDKLESMAIRTVFGDYAKKLAISSCKSMIGHLLGAAGAVEAIASAFALQNGVIPPTMNYSVPDPDCGDLDFVPNEAREAKIDVAISNSLGFGGHNCTIALKRFEG